MLLPFFIFLTLLVLAWRKLLLEGLLPIDGNMIAVSYPNWRLARSLWENPRLPLWNSWRNMGTLHSADPITSALYPLQWIFSASGDFPEYVRLWVVFHSLLAAGFAAALAWRWTKRPSSCIGAAFTSALNGFFMARIVFPHHLASASWLMPVLYAVETQSCAGIGAGLAMQWLAGYPTFSLLTVLAAGILAFAKGGKSLKALAKGGLWAAGLSAVQLLPFLELLSLSSRGWQLNASMATQFSIPALQLFKELALPQWMAASPRLAGDPAMVSFYIGLPALILAGLGAAKGGRLGKFLLLGSASCLLLSLGRHIPGYAACGLTRLFRYPANWLFPASGFLALLAALGLSHLKSRWAWGAALLIGADLVLFAQYPKSAWGKPEFLSAPPALARTIQGLPRPCRVYHEEGLMRAWAQGTLEAEEDYLLMRDFLAPSYGMAFGIEDISNYQTLRLKKSDEYRAQLASVKTQELLDRAGACLVIGLKSPAAKVERSNVLVRFNPRARPRVFIQDGEGKAAVARHAPGKVEAEVEARGPVTLVFAEMNYPGWKAEVDGGKAKIGEDAEPFLSLRLPPGKHRVIFRFSPASFWLGLLASALSLAGLALSCAQDIRVFLKHGLKREAHF